jgi:hypothetical protein
MMLAALFRCSNHKEKRLATLMIQGAYAAYARLPRDVFLAGKISRRHASKFGPNTRRWRVSMLRIFASRPPHFIV